MRLKRFFLAASLVLSLAALVNAGTRSNSDAGIHIAPGVLGPEARANPIPDGIGGAYVGFVVTDYSGGSAQPYAGIAHIGPDGAPDPAWTTHPVAGYDYLGAWATAYPVTVARAGPGTAWLISDWAGVGEPLYGRIHPSWPENLDVSGNAPTTWIHATALTLDDGRTLVVGKDGKSASNNFQTGLLNPAGAFEPVAQDILLFGTSGGSSTLIADGAGGALSVVNRMNIGTTTERDVVTLRFQSDGQPAWSPPTRVVTQAVRDQSEPSICGDGAGGAYIAWADGRDLSLSQDVYAMHILPDGERAPSWTLNGKRIITAPGDQFHVKLAADGAGGCWMVWTDSRSGVNQIYYTRLGGDGSPAPGYPVGGRALSVAPGSQIEPAMVADGAGGFFCAWVDERNGNPDLYGQHIHATGVVMTGWDVEGTALCTEPSPQQEPSLVLSSPNHALVVWSDTRVTSPRYYSMAMPEDGAVTGVGPSRGTGLRLASAGAGRELEFSLSASATGEIRVEVFDASGRRVAEQRWQGPLSSERVRIPAASLRPGLYLARAGQAGATAVSRALLIR